MRHFEEVCATINVWLSVVFICGSAIACRVFATSGSGTIDALLGLFCLTIVSFGAYSTVAAWRRPETATDAPKERGNSGPA